MENRSKRKLHRWAVCFLSAFLIVLQCTFPVQAESRCPGGEHSWTEWQRVIRYDNYGNVVQEDCTIELHQYRTCTICGMTQYRTKEPKVHNFGPWATVRNGSCIQEGLMSRTCVDCGIVEQVSTGYGGHNYGNWVVMQPATCTAQGINYVDCQLCGHREYAYTDPVPHTFGEWSVKTAATDFTTGVRKRSCTVCHLEQEEVYYPDGTVFYGDNNNIVLELQQALNNGGYDCGTPDGSFGNNTWNAVVAFEGDHNLPLDGIGWPGIRKTLAGGKETSRSSGDPEGSDPSTGDNGSQNLPAGALKCSLKENKSYVPEGRDCYYVNEPVVIWVEVANYFWKYLNNVYCFDEKTGDKLIYDPHLYPDYKAGQDICIKELKGGYYTTFMLYHKVTPEDAEAGKYVFRIHAAGTDSNGNEEKSEIAELEVKTANGYYQPSRQAADPPGDPTIELRESTQAGHWMEDPSHYDGNYYYAKGEEIRYKIIVKNDTDAPIYNVVIGYSFSPRNIEAVKLPGQEEDLPYALDPEGDAHINIEVMEPGEHRAFYLWCAAEVGSGDKDTMKKEARLSYTRQDGVHKTIHSEPCEVNTAIVVETGSEG